MATSPPADDTAPPLTLGDPAVQTCPFPAYARLREEAPVYLDHHHLLAFARVLWLARQESFLRPACVTA